MIAREDIIVAVNDILEDHVVDGCEIISVEELVYELVDYVQTTLSDAEEDMWMKQRYKFSMMNKKRYRYNKERGILVFHTTKNERIVLYDIDDIVNFFDDLVEWLESKNLLSYWYWKGRNKVLPDKE